MWQKRRTTMKSGLENGLAVVTGGSGGIGSVVCRQLLECGARVAVIDIGSEKLTETEEKLSAFGEIKCYAMDISDVAGIPAGIEKIRSEMGEIDYLVQAAGLLRGKPAFDITLEDWDSVMNVNARGMFFVMKEVVKQSMQYRGGSIVNFSSMSGVRGMLPPMCGAHYSASKGAVVAMTMQGATEWAEYGVRVNAVAPGGVRVGGMIAPPPEAIVNVPLKKLSEPEDIGNGVCFLLSDRAAMITGQTMIIDGGSHVVGF